MNDHHQPERTSPADTKQDATVIVERLLDELQPKINEALPDAIVDAGLDPWKDVASGSETLGKINLLICTAKVKAKYSIKNMKGLSSMVIESMDIETLDTSAWPVVSGEVRVKASVDADLSAKAEGKITAECGSLKESVGISGKVIAKGVTGKGTAVITAEIGQEDARLDEMSFKNVSLDYDKIKVELDGLGIFNEFLGLLVDLIDALFGASITGLLADLLKPLLNDVYKAELPVSVLVADAEEETDRERPAAVR